MPTTLDGLRAAPVFDSPAEPRLVVFWRYADGRTGCGAALPARQAEALLAEYAARFPERHYWLEPAGDEDAGY